MFCKHCGNQIDNDSTFCSSCGAKLKAPVSNSDSNSPTNSQQTVNVNLSFGRHRVNNATSEENQNSVSELKFDPHYIKDDSPLILGIISFLLVFGFNLYISMANHIDQEIISAGQFILLIWRIIATVWVVNIAKALNVSQNWGWLAFFFPGVTLVILGSKKRLLYPSNYNELNFQLKSQINNNIAYQFSMKKDYVNALYFADKSVALDSENHFAYDTRGYIKYFLNHYREALVDFDKSISLDNSNPLKYYHRGYAKKELADLKGAFNDWTIASDKGYLPADESINKYCSELKYSG